MSCYSPPKCLVVQACHVLDVVDHREVELEELNDLILVLMQVLGDEHLQQVGVAVSRVEGHFTWSPSTRLLTMSSSPKYGGLLPHQRVNRVLHKHGIVEVELEVELPVGTPGDVPVVLVRELQTQLDDLE